METSLSPQIQMALPSPALPDPLKKPPPLGQHAGALLPGEGDEVSSAMLHSVEGVVF